MIGLVFYVCLASIFTRKEECIPLHPTTPPHPPHPGCWMPQAGWPPLPALALSSSRRWHLGSLPASQICCIAVLSRLRSRVTVQTSNASQIAASQMTVTLNLTLSCRESGELSKGEKGAYLNPKTEQSTAGSTQASC